jgi:hypothetical protein
MQRAWELINAYKVFAGNPEGKNNCEVLGVDGSMILRCIRGMYYLEGVDWIYVAVDVEIFELFLNVIMNVCVPY